MPPTSTRPLGPIVSSETVQLFADRAAAVDRQFRLTAANAPAVTEICRSLDGLPLAIELAAARLRWESVQVLLARTASPLAALAFGERNAPVRQRTMRATIDWSYRLLSEPERSTFCICAMFAGAGTLDAVDAVATAGGASIPNIDSAMMALADKHLLRLSMPSSSQARFEMFEVIR